MELTKRTLGVEFELIQHHWLEGERKEKREEMEQSFKSMEKRSFTLGSEVQYIYLF